MTRQHRTAQSGQALVAALITVAIIFALGGGLAMAASAVLTQQREQGSPFTQDLLGQSGVNAVTAAIGAQGGCPSGALGLSGEITGYSCTRIPLIRTAATAAIPMRGGSNCAIGQVSATGHVSAWLNAGGGTFYIDGSGGGCTPAANACIASTSGRTLLVRDCDLAQFGSAWAHFTGASAATVRYATAATFIPAASSPFAVPGPARAVAVGRFHGANDGIEDLAVAFTDPRGPLGRDNPDSVAIYRGNGDGTFVTSPCATLPASLPTAVTVADFNGDGLDDVAFTSIFPDRWSVSVYLAQPGRACSFAQMSGSPFGVGRLPVALVGARLQSGAGPADLAITNAGSDSVSVLLNNGTTFGASVDYALPNGASPTAVVAAPLSSAALDLAVAAPGLGDIAVLRNRGDGSFAPPTFIAVAGAPGGIAAADFNGDGSADLAVTSLSTSAVTVLYGDGRGHVRGQATLDPGGTTGGIVVGDFDGLGNPGLAVLRTDVNGVVAFIGDGAGGFVAAPGGMVGLPWRAAALAADPFVNRVQPVGLVMAGGSQVSILLPNPETIFSVLAPGATQGYSFDEADVSRDAQGSFHLRYEGGL